jgi:hypothetical protein
MSLSQILLEINHSKSPPYRAAIILTGVNGPINQLLFFHGGGPGGVGASKRGCDGPPMGARSAPYRAGTILTGVNGPINQLLFLGGDGPGTGGREGSGTWEGGRGGEVKAR